MDRRTYLSALALSVTSAGCVESVVGDDTSRPAYLDEGPIVYEREPLQLRAPTDTVRPGESITFEIRHTGDSEEIGLGCNVEWAIQKYEDDEWKHAVWTDKRWSHLCLTMIAPEKTLTQTVPLSGSALADDHGVSDSEADITFRPGKHRFVLTASNPQLAVNFDVRPE